MLTTFDPTFDFTFARAGVSVSPLPPVGGDGASSVKLGGRLTGAVMPFAKTPAFLGSTPTGQAYETIGTITSAVQGFLPPFAILLPRPEDITLTPWCLDRGTVLEARTGRIVDNFTTDIVRLMSADTLFMIAPSGSFQLDRGGVLDLGRYQLLLGDTGSDYRVSDVFEVVDNPCTVFRIVLDNPTPIGKLPYGKANFKQVFYVPGELTGPTYEETETRSGSELVSGTTTKVYTFYINDASEALLDALALVRFHRLVEVDVLNGDGTIARPIQAMAYQAKFKASQNGGNFDIELTLPVEVTSFSKLAAGCAPDDEMGDLLPFDCAATPHD